VKVKEKVDALGRGLIDYQGYCTLLRQPNACGTRGLTPVVHEATMCRWSSRVAHGLAGLHYEGSAQAAAAYDLHGSGMTRTEALPTCRRGLGMRPPRTLLCRPPRTLLCRTNGVNLNIQGISTSAAGPSALGA
jgi:hypothetical protein